MQGKVALITGASRGIGRAIAERLAREGVRVVAAAKSLDAHPTLSGTLRETVAAVEALGSEGLAVQCDVRDEASVDAAVAATIARFGRLDIAIHNAGALWWKPLLETPLSKFDLVMDVNARGAYALAYAAVPHLKAAGGGHFLVMSPPVIPDALGGKIAYMISKMGMTMVAQGVAAEFKRDGIAGNALWPETLVESAATRTYKLGSEAQWYKADLVADATWEVVRRDPRARTGRSLLVMDVLREAGVTDFTPYRCDPRHEPPLMFAGAKLPEVGGKDVGDGSLPT